MGWRVSLNSIPVSVTVLLDSPCTESSAVSAPTSAASGRLAIRSHSFGTLWRLTSWASPSGRNVGAPHSAWTSATAIDAGGERTKIRCATPMEFQDPIEINQIVSIYLRDLFRPTAPPPPGCASDIDHTRAGSISDAREACDESSTTSLLATGSGDDRNTQALGALAQVPVEAGDPAAVVLGREQDAAVGELEAGLGSQAGETR